MPLPERLDDEASVAFFQVEVTLGAARGLDDDEDAAVVLAEGLALDRADVLEVSPADLRLEPPEAEAEALLEADALGRAAKDVGAAAESRDGEDRRFFVGVAPSWHFPWTRTERKLFALARNERVERTLASAPPKEVLDVCRMVGHAQAFYRARQQALERDGYGGFVDLDELGLLATEVLIRAAAHTGQLRARPGLPGPSRGLSRADPERRERRLRVS